MDSPLRLIGAVLGLGTEPIARALEEHLARTVGKPDRVVVVGAPLGRALLRRGLPVIAVSPTPKRLKNGAPQVVATADALPFADGFACAVLLAGMPPGGITALRECARVARNGGVVALAASSSALLRRVAPPDVMSAMMIHAALVDIEQRQLGSTWLTTGRMRTWP